MRYTFIRVGAYMSTCLPAVIILSRFHEWWSSSEHSKAKDLLPIPPPPPHIPVSTIFLFFIYHLATSEWKAFDTKYRWQTKLPSLSKNHIKSSYA